MTEYVGFYRPGEVTLLLEPADPDHGGEEISDSDLHQVHDLLKSFGVDLHGIQFRGHAGPRRPVVLRHCHGVPHILHTVNLASWMPPDEQRGQEAAQLRGLAVGVREVGRLGAKLLQALGRQTKQQKALTGVLKVVEKLNGVLTTDTGPRGQYRLIAVTPNWLATPAQGW